MRCTQPMGLSPDAMEFLQENAVKKDLCTHCGRFDGYEKKVIGDYGMYESEDLYEYKLTNGKVAREAVQAEIWSSGPMVWLKLIVDGKEFLWDEEDIHE